MTENAKKKIRVRTTQRKDVSMTSVTAKGLEFMAHAYMADKALAVVLGQWDLLVVPDQWGLLVALVQQGLKVTKAVPALKDLKDLLDRLDLRDQLGQKDHRVQRDQKDQRVRKGIRAKWVLRVLQGLQGLRARAKIV